MSVMNQGIERRCDGFIPSVVTSLLPISSEMKGSSEVYRGSYLFLPAGSESKQSLLSSTSLLQ